MRLQGSLESPARHCRKRLHENCRDRSHRLCVGGSGDKKISFQIPKPAAEAASVCHCAPLHGARGHRTEAGLQALTGASSRLPEARSRSPPPCPAPLGGNFPGAGVPPRPGRLQERRDAGHPQGLCPSCWDQRSGTASPGHAFLRNLLRRQLPSRGPG